MLIPYTQRRWETFKVYQNEVVIGQRSITSRLCTGWNVRRRLASHREVHCCATIRHCAVPGGAA